MESRHVAWVTSNEIVGVARGSAGEIELLLRGKELVPALKSIRDSSEYREVFRDDGTSFEATRLRLPALGYFDEVAAFICIELLRNGADSELSRAFALTEPIIELAIDRLRISGQAIVGLAGELLMLDALCRRVADSRVAEVVNSWDGWRQSARDFSLDGIGVEVKTTTGVVSAHFVEGVHQIERDESENRLILVSIGLQSMDAADGNGFTIPQLVERISTRMSDTEVAAPEIERFQRHVAEYGISFGSGYDHALQPPDPAFTVPFSTTFFRAYDMDDAAIGVLRSHDIAAFKHVIDGTVRFGVDLSAHGRINTGNPVEGANQVAKLVLEEHSKNAIDGYTTAGTGG